jgi:hypothetical protein
MVSLLEAIIKPRIQTLLVARRAFSVKEGVLMHCGNLDTSESPHFVDNKRQLDLRGH